MPMHIWRWIAISIAAILGLNAQVAFANQTITLVDFEDGLPAGFYDYQGDASSVSAVAQIFGPDTTLARPNQVGDNGLLEIIYTVSDFGGVAQEFTDGPQDWSDSVSIQFWLYGANSGEPIQFEIFDNRSDPDSDTSERFEYRFEDNFTGWKQIIIPFTTFRRATDSQPPDAPDDGLTLTEVWGYSFVLPAASGSLYVDDIALNDFVNIADYEAGRPSIFFDFKGDDSSLTTDFTSIGVDAPTARPGQISANQVLAIDYNINDFGGATHSFGDAPQNWQSFVAFSFWFHGSGSGERFQIEILDNRSDAPTAADEHFEYVFTDDIAGWHQFVIPFARFVRSSDFQPDGAPDDGFNLTDVRGYSFTLPTQASGRVLIDQIAISRSIDAPLAQDQSIFAGSFSGPFFDFKDDFSTLSTEIITVEQSSQLALPGQSTLRQILYVTYTITGSQTSYGGFTNLFPTAKDWRGLTAFEFWFYGSATNELLQLELLTSRTDPTEDTSERYQYDFVDYLQGWRKIRVPFAQFRRARDFQPEGASNNGLNLEEMWGFSFTLPQSQGFMYLSDVAVIRDLAVIDFETALPNGWFPFPRETTAVTNTIVTVGEENVLARPGQEETNGVLAVNYSIDAFGGVAHVFDPSPQNWYGYTGIQFWFRGNNSGERFQFEIRENRSDPSTDTSEYFEHVFIDNVAGWRQLQIPFTDFQRATDFQPEGAPDDGFNLNEVWGYSFTFPATTGELYLDEILLYGLNATPGSQRLYLPLARE
ncbi:MAG: carbohydrate binding domain-containing protein [Chloroflexota bacterium]